ncbi:glycerol-3-phosphate dehydrogenase (NAD(P)+) [Rubricella aquisinus]|uniref:Glycerol-3-phosphate dehydrogenase [NAD(P)+] n=1 Tax=Rubricella aquisinus TaxID=2028108 RepID=A0A840WLP6_9RHOB|nr:NAD(P)H-dependent glycerol-3-phosphate dehydrogenase [Rubricella aquisinus]MBB5515461.1 glycerol-3-phosphate dehydrogenase (NAD(P)+) [Rubricella aquisinus]
MTRRIAIIGAGAFGSALAHVWASAGQDVTLIGRKASGQAPEAAHYATELPQDTGIVVMAVPAQATADALATYAPARDVPLVLTAKGVERGSLRLQTDIATGWETSVLTGPSFAADLRLGKPTALTLGSATIGAAHGLADALQSPVLRLYPTDDRVGAQIGGALKNVIAIACGAAMGAGLGESARAALLTRGLAELTRLTVALGGRAETVAGLSGLGDLTLTATSEQSRNYRFGLALGRGDTLPAGTVEGRVTAGAAMALAEQHGIDMPITRMVAALLDGQVTLADAMERLLSRPTRTE